MGLDMYLTKKVYVGANYEHRKVTGRIDIKVDGTPLEVNFKKVSYIEESVGYWRKANSIHKWFVENVQNGEDDCGTYYVDIEKMEELLGVCKTLISGLILEDGKISNGYSIVGGERVEHWEDGKIIKNPELADELLPTGSGFFFGSIDYDEYYYQDILDTVSILEGCLQDKSGEFYYHSSW